jgi:large subunit ribosomal protein L31
MQQHQAVRSRSSISNFKKQFNESLLIFFSAKFFVFYKKILYICRPKKEYKNYNINKTMRKGIHPDNYRPVAFKDMSNDDVFISRSTINARETIDIDGVTYPLVKLEITSSSHPFYTGKQKLVDTAGRVDKFMSRYGNRVKK